MRRDPSWGERDNWFAVFDKITKAGFPFDKAGRNDEPQFFKTRLEVIWHALKITLKKQIDKGRLVTDITKCLGDMQRVAGLVSFPINERKFAANLAVNAPKGWGPVDPHTLVPLEKVVVPKAPKAPKKTRPLDELNRLAPTPADKLEIDWHRKGKEAKSPLSAAARAKIVAQLKSR